MTRNHLRLAPTMLIACLVAFAATLTVRADMIKFTLLTPQQVARLSKEARQNYDQALAAIDKINYKLGITQLNKAIETEPDNVHLRFMVVQIARYMGDKSSSADSIKYYDLAIQHLKAIADSSRLNSREKTRAEESIDEVTKLRASVTERDEARQKAGHDIAVKYVNKVYAKTEAELTEEARTKRFKATEQLRQTLIGPLSGAPQANIPGILPGGEATIPPLSRQTTPAELGTPMTSIDATEPGPPANEDLNRR